MKYFTRENITLVIAIFGAIGTIFTWIHNIITNRKNISLSIISAYHKNNIMVAYIMIENKSRMPICINSFSLTEGKKKVMCKQIPTKIIEITNRSGTEITDRRNIYSCKFPISLGALSSDSVYTFFDLRDINIDISEELNFLIATNRGKELSVRIIPKYVDSFEKLY